MKKLLQAILMLTYSLTIFAQGGGTCAYFDGTNDYLTTGGQNYGYNTITTEFWAYATDWTPSSTQILVTLQTDGSGEGYKIELRSSDIRFYLVANSAKSITVSTSSLSTGWHHIAATYDGSDMNLWVDGETNTNIEQIGDVDYGTYELRIGTHSDGSDDFSGYIDELRFWRVARSQSEIQSLMHISGTTVASYTDLRGYYRFESNTTPAYLENEGNASGNDLTNSGCSFEDQNTPIGDFPTGYTTDPEAVWRALGTDWSDESTGMALRDYSTQSFGTSEFYAFANNNLTGTSTSDIPSTVAIRASTIWYIDDAASDRVDFNFDLSDFGASAIEETGLPASNYVLLRRDGTSGDFSVVDNGTSITSGEIYIEYYLPTDGYYTVGREIVNPTVTTTVVSDIGNETASSGGDVTDDGGGTVSARGVCWSTSSNPTTDDDFTTDGTGTGSFVSSLTSLCQGTTYYVRAYATNEAGTAYGSEESFSATGTPLTLTTQAVSDISYVTATGNGNITALGSANPTAHGVCWNTGGTPTLADDFTDEGATSSTGAFNSEMTGLDPGTTYYVRSYATSTCGTAYGDQVSFSTTAGLSNVVYSNLDDGGTYTLRSVLTAASDGAEITFNLPSGSETIVIGSQIEITKNITIDGDNTAGSGTDVTVQVTTPGTSSYRVFYLNSSGKTYTLNNINLRGGAEDQYGSVIYLNFGSIHLDNVEISDGANGDFVIGGGLYIRSTADSDNQITNSTFTDNSAGFGGGIVVDQSVTIENSLFSANEASGWGGGIYLEGGTLELTNCTFTGNQSNDKGGGIYISSSSGTVTINNCTFAENHCGSSYNGGGIYKDGSVTLIVKNSILANNYQGSGTTTGDDYYYKEGSLTDNGYNIVEYQSGSITGTLKTFTHPTNFIYTGSGNDWSHSGGTITGQLNLSSTLADNGGPTQTLAISSGSFAISEGSWDAGITTDQRGESRHEFYPTIGAYEPRYAGYWIGTTDNDWNTSTNWDDGAIAGSSDDVIIPNVANDPEVGVTGTATCDDLTIKSGATLTLKSTSSGTASLIVEGTATGNVSVERFLTHDKWHYISGQTNISGTFTEIMGLGTPGSSTNQFYRWDESLNSEDDTGFWIDILNGPTGNGTGNEMGQSFTACRGYAVTYKTTDKTLSLSGIPYTDNKTITITKTDASSNPGANLVGNPFCSTIAINTSAQETNNFIDQNSSVLRDDARAVYFWDESQNDYEVKNNASGAIYAAPGQGFMVISKSASESLEFNVNTRKHGSATFYKNSPNDDVSRIKLLVNDLENRSNITTIAFLPDMTLGLDPSFDAAKLKGNPDIALYTMLVEDNGVDFAIQALPPLSDEKLEVKIGLDISTAGNYTFKIKELENFDETTSVKLEDKKSGSLIDFHEIEEYSFNINQAGQIRERFVLHFNNAAGIEDQTSETENIRFYVYDNKLYIIDKELKNGTIQVFNMLGQPVMEKQYSEAINTLDLSLKQGYYIVRIVTKKATLSGKIFVE
ncbi:MAG: T9SS type A sorting domain-containing protein [Bacteroidales bacterium]|nr:T9SS type A sorting domain-containing protein [Bacteroidales bacterium]